MTTEQAQIALGLLAPAVLFVCAVVRRKWFWQLETLLMAFFAGSEIPPAFVLCLYGLTAHPSGTKLAHHLGIYISAGGLILLLSSLSCLGTLFVNAVGPIPATKNKASEMSEDRDH